RLILRAPSRKFKILVIPNILAHRKSYEQSFTKKHDGHKPCANSRKVAFQLVFCAPSHKFKILAIPNVLAHGMPYENGLVKKRDGHKVCAKSHFD
ncbi:hypothetical protein B296_00051811, partial [Ensete ventricosum]